MSDRPAKPPAPAKAHALLRYVQAASGPIATAVAHFVLSLVLLHGVSPSMFGNISFLLIASQFGAGIWGALFCAPLPVMLVQARLERDGDEAAIHRCILASNLLGAAAAFACFWGAAMSVGLTIVDAGLFAGYCAAYLLRWFARANAYVLERPLAALASDLVYSAVLLVSLLAMSLWPAALSLRAICMALLLAALVSVLPFGAAYLRSQFVDLSLSDARRYVGIWRKHSSWSLLGVITTEATANSHAYLLTFFAGPGAFAPIAASALLIRPIGVLVNALTEMERPHVARLLGQHRNVEAFRALRFFRLIMLTSWGLGAALAAVLLAYVPELVFPSSYTLRFLVIGTTLWMLVMFARQWRAPDSVLLQAAGDFRTLARASMVSALASIGAVIGLLAAFDPVWSIGGIAVGETLCTLWTWRQAQCHRKRMAISEGIERKVVSSATMPAATWGADLGMEKK